VDLRANTGRQGNKRRSKLCTWSVAAAARVQEAVSGRARLPKGAGNRATRLVGRTEAMDGAGLARSIDREPPAGTHTSGSLVIRTI
jgi:hypothetical protein